MNPAHSLVREHVRAGGRALVLEQGINGDMIALYDNGAHFPLLWTYLIPATMEGKATHNVQNAMFAAGIAFSLGKTLDDIRHGLRTFDSTFFQAPGRMNVFDEHPFRVILDYGHNAAAMRAVCQLVDRLDVAGQRICLLGAPGDRRDCDIRSIADETANHFDRFICREDDNRRGRERGAVANMLRDRLVEKGVAAGAIEVNPDETAAVSGALSGAGEGDLLMIFGDDITRCWKQVISFEADSEAEFERGDAKTVQSFVEEDPLAFSLDEGEELIRDERGVRIARQEEESD
jgi:cyanophycin synthetase